jgi:hypothetical protein
MREIWPDAFCEAMRIEKRPPQGSSTAPWSFWKVPKLVMISPKLARSSVFQSQVAE